ncbi:MAG: helix-turn-helix transcriptional regulator [Halioglobus sp.]|nr:helix-turn-helix transcriptional regulator [Halioglobus sp.]
MDLIGFLYGFGVLHGVVLAVILLYSSGGNRRANLFMATLVACIAIRFLSNWLVRTDFFLEHPPWALAARPLDLAWGPLLYLYARSIADRPVGMIHLLHFIPALLLCSAPITLAQYPHQQQVQFLTFMLSDRQDTALGGELLQTMPAFWRTWMEMHLHGSFFTLQFGCYCYLVLRQIQQHNLALERHFSFTDQMNLRWLRTLTWLCVFFLLLFLVFNRGRLVLFGDFESTALSPNMPFLFMVLVIYVIGIMALRQPRIERQDSTADSPDNAQSAAPETDDSDDGAAASGTPKYARSGISLEDAQRYKIQLMEIMREKELYLDCDLTLGDLAEEAGMTYHQASQVINGQMNQKFFSFVNSYRIQRAKDMLANQDTAGMPIVELALEVGFKSKSSFYDAFKKATDLTPTQFRNSLTARGPDE